MQPTLLSKRFSRARQQLLFPLFFPIFCLLLPGQAQALPVIQELYYDQTGSDGSDVFTELYGDPGFDFTGWQLWGLNGSDGSKYRTINLTGAIIPTDGILLITTNRRSDSLALLSDFEAAVDWQNGPDAVQLVDDTGRVADAIQYGTTAGFNVGEGAAATDVAAGFSLSRRTAGFDTNDNANDFLELQTPTPGAVTFAAAALLPPAITPLLPAATTIPVSSTGLLLLLGLVPLFSMGRRS